MKYLVLYNTTFIKQLLQKRLTLHKTSREKVITTLKIYQYWIFHHTVSETCFEMLKSSEHEKLGRYSN